MEDSGPTANLFIFIGLLLIDMLFYGFGAAIQNINNKEVQKNADENDKRSKYLLQIMEQPSSYVGTVQFVVTLINIIMGGWYLGSFLTFVKKIATSFIDLNMHTVSVVTMVATVLFLVYVILTFGVLIPKRVASKYPSKWAYACIYPIYYITKLLYPVTALVNVTAKALLLVFGVKDGDELQDVTEEEIISMVNEGHEQGVFLANEAEMISNIFEYGDKEANDIMTHRKNIIGIDSNTPLKDVIRFILKERNSRYPVYEENIDHIIGIIYLKDAMRMHEATDVLYKPIKDIKGLIRSAEFIPETRKIDALFQTMQTMKIQMVIVADEYGQTAGLVTMEDILEEIFGNILDEYDEVFEHIEEKGKDKYLIEGMTRLEELEERFLIDFEEEEFETLNGFLISKLEKIPEENEVFDVNVCDYNFKVISVENKMIKTVLVTKNKKEEEAEDVRTF